MKKKKTKGYDYTINRGAYRKDETLKKLIKRAAMSDVQFGTQIVRSTDDAFRINISSSRNEDYGDCIGISFMRETEGEWSHASFSPAKARIIAHHLLERARLLEKGNGLKTIDKVIDA